MNIFTNSGVKADNHHTAFPSDINTGAGTRKTEIKGASRVSYSREEQRRGRGLKLTRKGAEASYTFHGMLWECGDLEREDI